METTTQDQLSSTESTTQAQLSSTESTTQAQLSSTESSTEPQLSSTESSTEAQFSSTDSSSQAQLSSVESTTQAQLSSVESTTQAQLSSEESTTQAQQSSEESSTHAPRPSETRILWNQDTFPGPRGSKKSVPARPALRNGNVFMGHGQSLHRESWREALIPHRPGLVQVIFVACVVFSVALMAGLIVSFVMYRLSQAEERQQLALLYKNIRIPLLEDEEVYSEEDSQDESTYLLPENEKELENFIHSVIRSKRKKYIENKRKKEVKIASDDALDNAMYSP
ncbi:PREDICTED: uncharacterized protein C19orf18 homolog [Condylura cristata]|uniref:uncharacterized protein C19orf18 homolog n=1 Tax=Condylura cristata TaxID=143302 RepID=UPI0006438B94|nr:PREDICTED: uncharacterized protein C19orf18 homolog [Condylura cristata]